MRQLVKNIYIPLTVFLTVTGAGSMLLVYAVKHTASAQAQTAGGTMGSYELNFIRNDDECYVTLTASYFDKKMMSYSSDTVTPWNVFTPAFIWHYNTKTKAWEEVPAKK
jgi:hypothetical protein